MAKSQAKGTYRRVAEGIYERNGSYYVPIYYSVRPDTGKPGKLWHGPGAKACRDLGCRHTPIVDLTAARAAKRELEADKASTVRGMAPVKTVRQWAAPRREGGQWLTRLPRKEESTNLHNEERVGRFIKWLDLRGTADIPLGAVTEEMAAEYVQEHPSASREARAMFNDAVKLRLVDRNPFANLTFRHSRGRKDIVVLTLPELEDLLAIARAELREYGERFALMLEIAAWTGVRPGELYLFSFNESEFVDDGMDVLVNHVDFAHRCIHVDWAYKKTGVGRPKYESQRPVAMLPPAETALRKLLAHVEGKDENGMCFLTPRGSRFTARNQNYYWDKVRREFARSRPANHWLRRRLADDPSNGDLDLYELRHFFGSALAQPPWQGIRPASPYEIAAQMGHKDKGALAMDVYIHTDSERANSEILDAWAGRVDVPAGERASGE